MLNSALPASNDPPSAEIDHKVEAEMTRLLYRSAGFGLFSNLVLACVLVAGTFQAHPLSLHLGWLAAILAVSLARLALNAAYARAQPTTVADHQPWRHRFIVGVAVAGVTWGAAAWLYFTPDQLMPCLLLVCILVGMNAGAARSLASVPWSYRIYVGTTMGPLLAQFIVLPDSGAWTFVGVGITYALFLLNTAQLHHADLRHLWRLIFENRDLVATLSQEKARAESASLAKSEFLATMSHEIRTPMNGVVGMLQVLENSPLNAEQKAQLDTAMGSADTLMRLFNDILDLSKLESGKLKLASTAFALPHALRAVGHDLLPRARQKNLELLVTLPPDLPAYVAGDEARVKQVLFNLAANAIKFTENGRVEIAAAAVHQQEQVCVVRFDVRDTGIGMDEATQAKLFRVFSPGDSSMTRRFGGTGLGLAISQRLVNQMGGHITVQCKPAAGSVFSFELALPLAPAPAKPLPPAAAPSPGALAGRVLIVEDDRVNQRVIELLLRKLGLTPVVVGDGATAVECATRQTWTAILMDCQMPEMDGFEATRRIRQHLAGRPLPIIAITANALAGDRAACVAAGMDDFLAKPVKQEELRACLARWIPPSGA
ncbi:ATP-binding protein [Horticoccus sp. 23ND18S-11]|uniref:ATP-binding protein n=1 Tax=Horticoccus sp. 23ND18S-11 TaxID=3391832 RepID=UPI0039C8F5D4